MAYTKFPPRKRRRNTAILARMRIPSIQMRPSLDPRPSFRFIVVCLTVIKAKTRPGIKDHR